MPESNGMDAKQDQEKVSSGNLDNNHIVTTPTNGEVEQGYPLLQDTNGSNTVGLVISGKEKEAEEDAYICGSSDGSRESSPSDEGRETWGKKVDFLLSIIGFAVDLANVWRFPNLCYKNGGGAFLIPYFTMLAFGAIPLFYMELVLGQFHKQGAVGVWKIAPIFKGVGIAECLIAYLVAFYYNVVIAWSVFYLISSFTFTLPWTSCTNPWNTKNCKTLEEKLEFIKACSNVTANYTINADTTYNTTYTTEVYSSATQLPWMNSTINCDQEGQLVSPVDEFFERRMLGLDKSDGIHDVGPPRWQLVLCLMLVFVLLYFSLWKGVKSSGKVVWITATMPYVILSILLVRGVFLEGAMDGLIYFLKPDLTKLNNKQVWIDAAIQVFYSTGAGFGVHLAYASYNKFHNNCYRDCMMTACVNSFTSIFSGLVIFSYLGYMSHRANVGIDQVAQEGPGLTFVVYPAALATLPGSFVWSIIFFFMLITLGLDSAMGGLEAALTGLRDEMPQIRKYKYHREILTLIVCGSAFIFALQNITNGGMYLFNIWDTMAAGTTLLLCVFTQAVAIGWFYGLDQFNADIHKMLGFTPGIYWRICWKFISPIFLLVIICFNVLTWEPLTYTSTTHGEYIYPLEGNIFAWLIVLVSMIFIPGAAIYKFCKMPGSFSQRIALCISPQWEHTAIIKGGVVKRFQLSHWISLGKKPTVIVKGHPL